LAALCPAAARAASRDVRAREAPDECQWASLRAVVQKVDSLANCQSLPDHQAAACTVFPARLAASGAWVGPDVDLRQNAARFPASFQALAPGSPSPLAERAQQDVPQARQVPPPQVALKKVAR